jgi:hypothetical protein
MTNVRVYKMPKGAMKAELLALLKVAGCVIIDDEDGCFILIVILDSTLLQDEDFEDALFRATQEGCRVIGVWPKGTTSGETPECFEDYRSGTVIWDPARLCDVLGGKPRHDAPTGKPIEYPNTPRNQCKKHG